MALSDLLHEFKRRTTGDGTGATLVRGTGGALFVRIGGAGIAFILNVVLARVLGESRYGIYVYALAWINVLALVAKSGMDMLLVRFVPAYKANGELSRLRGLVRFTGQWTLGFSALVAAITLGVVMTLDVPPGDARATYLAAVPLVVLIAMLALPTSALRGLKHIVASLTPEILVRPALIMAGVIALYLLAGQVSARDAMLINVGATGVALMAALYGYQRNRPEGLAAATPSFSRRTWLTTALPMLLISGMHMLLRRVDVIMLGALAGTTDAGFYNAATRIADLVTMGLMAVNTIAAPMISELYAGQQHAKLQRMITYATRGILLLTATAGVALVVLGKPILALFGPAFVVAFVPLLILVAGQVVNATAGPTGFIMTMTGRHNHAALVLFVTLFANIILNAALIPRFGMNGAAIATALSTVIWNVALVVYIMRKLRINPLPFGPAPRSVTGP